MVPRYLHDKWKFPLYPGKTIGEQVVDNCLCACFCVVATPIVLVGAAICLPFYGGMYAIDFCCDVKKKRNHDKNMQCDWKYRFRHLCPHISRFTAWESFATNQYDRAILQVAEADDVPFELWDELCSEECKHMHFFEEQKKLYGTYDYQKWKCTHLAMTHFREQYDVFMNKSMRDVVDELINNQEILLNREKPDWMYVERDCDACACCDQDAR